MLEKKEPTENNDTVSAVKPLRVAKTSLEENKTSLSRLVVVAKNGDHAAGKTTTQNTKSNIHRIVMHRFIAFSCACMMRIKAAMVPAPRCVAHEVSFIANRVLCTGVGGEDAQRPNDPTIWVPAISHMRELRGCQIEWTRHGREWLSMCLRA